MESPVTQADVIEFTPHVFSGLRDAEEETCGEKELGRCW